MWDVLGVCSIIVTMVGGKTYLLLQVIRYILSVVATCSPSLLHPPNSYR